MMRALLLLLPLAVPLAAVGVYVEWSNASATAQACRIAYWKAGEAGGHEAARIAERQCLLTDGGKA